MEKVMMDEQLLESIRITMNRIRQDREKFREIIVQEIEELIYRINNYDKIYVLGGLGVKLIKSTRNFFQPIP
ncbi:MAG: hypothetical protein IPM82_10990 [Saprospiraceae bacterium]|nr:hypothetical protein [Saprospiraceae bacterium]